jgi:hypothetical protein
MTAIVLQVRAVGRAMKTIASSHTITPIQVAGVISSKLAGADMTLKTMKRTSEGLDMSLVPVEKIQGTIRGQMTNRTQEEEGHKNKCHTTQTGTLEIADHFRSSYKPHISSLMDQYYFYD